ncbi:MAG: carboxylesterase [Ponticaulis sp.]|nr:carboxylesterase [Ponticaulis sp.]
MLTACQPTEQSSAPSDADMPVSVDTTYGPVQAVDIRGLKAFLAIPFAAPPVGELRWSPPQPPERWDAPLINHTPASICMQTPFDTDPPGTPPPSEDCLYLNVWAPAEPPETPLPVMVWIHGGGFTAGTAAHPVYTPDALVNEGVIYVSIAYRLGPFGFLAHPGLSEESATGTSGNYGLLDQIEALKWVKSNIAGFGGDPDNITIFGESAGGMSVAALKTSPLAAGLFDKAISQSGGLMTPPAETLNPASVALPTLSQAEAIGEDLFTRLNTADITSARALSAETLLGEPSIYAPVLDDVILPLDIRSSYETGQTNAGPLLIGWNSDEGAMFVHADDPAAFQASIRDTYGDAAEEILSVYPHDTPEDTLQSARDLFRDSAFAWSSLTMARLVDERSEGPVFAYVFNQHLPVDPGALMYSAAGSTHASEISYVFGSFDAPVFGFDPRPPAYTDADKVLSDQMTQYWVNFAKTGNPNGEGLPLWPEFHTSDEQLMELKSAPAPIDVPQLDKLNALETHFVAQRAAWLGSFADE